MKALLTTKVIRPLKVSKRPASKEKIVSLLPSVKPPVKKPAAAAGSLGPTGKKALALKAKSPISLSSILAAASVGRPLTAARVDRWAAASEEQIQKFGHPYSRASAPSGGTTLLEKVVVLDSGDADYVLRVQAFEQWRVVNQLPRQASLNVVLHQFLDYLDDMFLAGGGQADASRTWTGLMHLVPQLRDQVPYGLRVRKALSGWAKRAPTWSRAPIAEVVVMALIGDMIGRKMLPVALNCLLQYLTCLRPGEVDALLVDQLIPPSKMARGHLSEVWGVLRHPLQDSMPGKTGESDKIILLDDPEWSFMSAHWRALTANRPPKDPLFPMGVSVIDLCFQASVENLNLQTENLVRYGIRQAGANNDLVLGKRSREEVETRAGLITDSPLNRYTKETYALQALHRIPLAVTDYGTFVKENLPTVLTGQVPLHCFHNHQFAKPN